ncbi:hypothetical protein HYT17_01575 [Candidatus Microgenomates bacterium]|nr:hypothetical protein [Candidatus Microgenomates bacterium]
MAVQERGLRLSSLAHELGGTVVAAKKAVRRHPVKTAVFGGLGAAAVVGATILYARGSASPAVAQESSSRVSVSEPGNLPPPAFIDQRPAIGAGAGGGDGGGDGPDPKNPNGLPAVLADQPGASEPTEEGGEPPVTGGGEGQGGEGGTGSESESAVEPAQESAPQVRQPPAREVNRPPFIADVKIYRGETVADEVIEKVRNWIQEAVANMDKSGNSQLAEMADYIRKANRPRPGRPVDQQLDFFVSSKKGAIPTKETVIRSTRGGRESLRPALELYSAVIEQWDSGDPRVMSDVWYRVAWLREFFQIAAERELSLEQILELYNNAGSDEEIARMGRRLLEEGRNIIGGLGGSPPAREIPPSPDAGQSGYRTEWTPDSWAGKMIAEGKFRVDSGSPPNDNRPQVTYWGGKLVGVSDLERGLSVEILFPNGEIKKFFFTPPEFDASWPDWLKKNGATVVEKQGTATSLLVGNCGDNGCRWIGSLNVSELRRMPAGVIVGVSVLKDHDENNDIAGSGPDAMSFSFYTR